MQRCKVQTLKEKKMPPKGKGKKASGRKMPPPLPLGEVLTDGVRKREWVIGTSIGKGGFGEIYLAALKGKDVKNAEHVIKIVSKQTNKLTKLSSPPSTGATREWAIV